MRAEPQTIFITGASGGIGETLALAYARAGARIGITARRAEELERVAVRLRAQGAEAACYAVDVTDHAGLRQAAKDFVARFGAPDVVIANAGISAGTFTEYEEDLAAFDKIMQVNVTGMFATFQPFVAAMKARGSGILAGIASVASVRGLPGSGGYCASKAAVVSYLEALRGELRASGIQVVTVCPGYIRTPLTAKNKYPMPFLMDADDAARRIQRVINSGTSYAVVPWQMGLVAKLLRALPNWLFDRVLANKPTKTRAADGQQL
jgi:short-subunit dehydrogenase